MALKLMYITNDVVVAQIAEESGVDRIFLDMEHIGKALRQGGMDTVQNHHTIDDIRRLKHKLQKAKLLVRCNPIHEKTIDYESSEWEIEEIINAGADFIMLPYFKSIGEVQRFLSIVRGRVKTVLLFETPESKELIEKILELKGIDEAFIGLNDLSLGYHKDFMFELLIDGTVEEMALKFREKDIPFGFGGIAAVGKGMLPAEKIIKEHYRMFSQSVILSRSFCDTKNIRDISVIRQIFGEGIMKIREVENECEIYQSFFGNNIESIENDIKQIKMRLKK